jgi:hypothetical protein
MDFEGRLAVAVRLTARRVTGPCLGLCACGAAGAEQVVDEWDDLLLVPCFLATPRPFVTELGNTPAFKPTPSDRKKLLKVIESCFRA